MEVDARQIGRVLRFARDLIKTKDTWSKKWMAFNSAGIECPPESVTAKFFCGLGAIYRAAFELKLKDVRTATLNEVRKDALRLYRTSRLEKVNDEHGHAAVLRCYDATLKRLTPAEVKTPKRAAAKRVIKKRRKAG